MTATVTKPAATRKPAAKPKKDEKKPEHTPEYGMEKKKDVPWNSKKVAVIKALKSLKGLGVSSAKTSAEIAGKANVSPRDVRHYCYHAKAGGLVGIAKVEEKAGNGFYLTAKGAAIDPDKELKSQNTMADKK